MATKKTTRNRPLHDALQREISCASGRDQVNKKKKILANGFASFSALFNSGPVASSQIHLKLPQPGHGFRIIFFVIA